MNQPLQERDEAAHDEEPCRTCDSGRDGSIPCMLVIFGASGHLTAKKLMPALYRLDKDERLPQQLSIMGYARTPKRPDEFRAEMKQALQESLGESRFSPQVWKRFAGRLDYMTGQYTDPDDLRRLHSAMQSPERGCPRGRHVYYLALPPKAMENTLKVLTELDCLPKQEGTTAPRVMLEKPFGTDLESARRMNELLSSRFDESQIYRIDHYLAKETVQNLLVLRFSNSIFEPLWNRNYVDHVQITAAESSGIEGRGGYYDGVGAVRDMLQNHVLQVLALTAMEPPLSGDVESVRDKKTEVFKALSPITRRDFALGQYENYTDERGVSEDSATPTYAAARLHLQNWRWRGVPLYLRTGKCLPRKLTEVIIQFKKVPVCALPNPDLCSAVGPNRLVIRIQPNEGLGLFFSAKSPGREDRLERTQMRFDYADLGGDIPDAYEHVVLDGLRGEPGLFWRADGIEAAWKAVQPLLNQDLSPDTYGCGTWGPESAQKLIRSDGRTWLAPTDGEQ